MVLDKEKPCKARDLNLAAIRLETDQLTNCSFRVVKKVKA
jgi:hypothetical protein